MAMMSSFPLVGSFVAATVIPNIFEDKYNALLIQSDDIARWSSKENGFYAAHINGFWVCIICYVGILVLCVLDKWVEKTDDAWL